MSVVVDGLRNADTAVEGPEKSRPEVNGGGEEGGEWEYE